MLPPYALVLAGALFKKRVREPGANGAGARSREKAIREKVVDDLRGREDTLRERETALAAREEEHGRKSAELALKLQELAVRETELRARYGEGGGAARPSGEHHLPPDADSPEAQERLVRALEHRLAGARARHDELRRAMSAKGRHADTIAAYRSSGYVVARLEKLKDLPPAELEKALEKFEKDATLLEPLAARIDALDRAVEKEAEALRARCNDPDAVADIERGIKELEGRVEARRERLDKSVERWRAEGYALGRLDRLAKAGLVALEEAAAKYEEDLEVLRLFSEKLAALEPSARKEASRLETMLKDPDNIPALEKGFLALEKEAGLRRQAFLELFEKWRSEGFSVAPLEKVLSADLPAMRSAFLKFEEDVSRLRALSERASRLGAPFAARLEALGPGLRDPQQLGKMELAIKEMEEESGKGKVAPVKRARAPPPKVVSTRKAPPAPQVVAGPKGPPAVPAKEEAKARAALPAKAEAKAPPEAPAIVEAKAPPAPPAKAEAKARPKPEPKAPASAATETAAPSTPPAGKAPPGDDLQAEVAAAVAAAEEAIKELELRGINPAAASNLLRLGKSFNRSKNLAKALQYSKKARDMALAMKR